MLTSVDFPPSCTQSENRYGNDWWAALSNKAHTAQLPNSPSSRHNYGFWNAFPACALLSTCRGCCIQLPGRPSLQPPPPFLVGSAQYQPQLTSCTEDSDLLCRANGPEVPIAFRTVNRWLSLLFICMSVFPACMYASCPQARIVSDSHLY